MKLRNLEVQEFALVFETPAEIDPTDIDDESLSNAIFDALEEAGIDVRETSGPYVNGVVGVRIGVEQGRPLNVQVDEAKRTLREGLAKFRVRKTRSSIVRLIGRA